MADSTTTTLDDINDRPQKMRKLSHSETEHFPNIHGQDSKSFPVQANGQQIHGTTEVDSDSNNDNDVNEGQSTIEIKQNADGTTEGEPLSKRAQKKLLKLQQWEAGRGDRALKRKEKRKVKQERRREEVARAEEQGIKPPPRKKEKPKNKQQVPMTFIIDCSFDTLMTQNESISLSSQVVRCYSGIQRSQYQPRLMVSSFGSRLRERFVDVLKSQYKSWQNVEVTEGNVAEAHSLAKPWMVKLSSNDKVTYPDYIRAESQETAASESASDGGSPTLVYLTAESDNVLTTLSPNTSYVIGGLVDKNRHKGHCHGVAEKAGFRTARLPIDAYVKLNRRKVLTTNHVVEIMLKYLETGDWAQSFLHVIPTRTGVGALEQNEEQEGDESDSQHGNSHTSQADVAKSEEES